MNMTPLAGIFLIFSWGSPFGIWIRVLSLLLSTSPKGPVYNKHNILWDPYNRNRYFGFGEPMITAYLGPPRSSYL